MAVLDKGAEDAAGGTFFSGFPSWSDELSSQAHDRWTMLNGMSGIQNHQATPSMFYLHG